MLERAAGSGIVDCDGCGVVVALAIGLVLIAFFPSEVAPAMSYLPG
jgi:hypothetical protein